MPYSYSPDPDRVPFGSRRVPSSWGPSIPEKGRLRGLGGEGSTDPPNVADSESAGGWKENGES